MAGLHADDVVAKAAWGKQRIGEPGLNCGRIDAGSGWVVTVSVRSSIFFSESALESFMRGPQSKILRLSLHSTLWNLPQPLLIKNAGLVATASIIASSLYSFDLVSLTIRSIDGLSSESTPRPSA